MGKVKLLLVKNKSIFLSKVFNNSGHNINLLVVIYFIWMMLNINFVLTKGIRSQISFRYSIKSK